MLFLKKWLLYNLNRLSSGLSFDDPVYIQFTGTKIE